MHIVILSIMGEMSINGMLYIYIYIYPNHKSISSVSGKNIIKEKSNTNCKT